MRTGLALMAWLGLIPSANAQTPVIGTCSSPRGATGIYLRKICDHVVANHIPVTSHPNTWTVVSIKEKMEGQTPLVIVRPSCCYLGDTATFNKATGHLIRYEIGDK